jgi:hypothetical protein
MGVTRFDDHNLVATRRQFRPQPATQRARFRADLAQFRGVLL